MAHAGVAVKALRTGLGLSIRQVAKLADVNPTMLSQVERGQREPSARWLKDVTDALGKYLGGAA